MRMSRRMLIAAGALLLAAAVPLTAQAADNSLAGKRLRLIVPNSPAGTMTRYARLLAPYIARHLHASSVRVDNEKGAGGLRGTNMLWNSKADGMTFAFTNVPALIMAQLAGSPGVRFDATKFTYLSRVASDPRLLWVGGKSKIKTVDDIRNLGRPFVFASQGTDEDFYTMVILADALGYKLKIVTGYEGNADTSLAVIKGDADGHMTGLTASEPAMKAGDKRPILVMQPKRLSELPNVPDVFELLKDPSKKPTVLAVVSILNLSRGFFGPPGMKTAVTKELRTGIKAALMDPALLKDAAKQHLPIVFAPGEEQQESIKQIVAASADLKRLLKEALAMIK